MERGIIIALLMALYAFGKKGGTGPTPGSTPGGMTFYRWSDEDMAAFAAAARRAGIEPALALAVYGSESGLNPHARNPNGGAAGIPQLLPGYMKSYGADPATFHQWSVAQQIPVIERLLKSQVAMLGSPPQTASKLYHLNFYPATAHDTIVVSQTSDPRAYNANKDLDLHGKGYIDEDDLRAFLGRVTESPDFSNVLAQLQRVDPGSIVGYVVAFE